MVVIPVVVVAAATGHDDNEKAGSSHPNVDGDDNEAEAAAEAATATLAAAAAATTTTFVGEKEKKKEEEEEGVVVVTEDDWGLAMDFHLFAQHEEYIIALPSNRRRRQRSTKTRDDDDDDDNNKEDDQTKLMASSLRLRCVESLTPLDMARLGGEEEGGGGVDGDATGHCVWTAAFFLLRFIYPLQDDFCCFTNRRVLELGCGTGFAGLAVALLTHTDHLTLTDRDPHVLALCQTNIQLNRDAIILAASSSATAATALDGYSGSEASSPTLCVRSLTWGQKEPQSDDDEEEEEEEEYGCFDTVLATDVLYDIALLPKLFQSAHHALGCHCRGRSSTTCRRRRRHRHHRDNNNNDDAEPHDDENDDHRRYYFVLSHVPRACYKSTDHHHHHPPPVADLDRYICDRALEHGLKLARVYRPTPTTLPGGDDGSGNDDDNDTEQETTTAFATTLSSSSSSTPPQQRRRLGDCRSMREMAEIGAAIFVFVKT